MSTTVDTKEFEFAQQVRRALDESTAALPEATLTRLSRARQAAMLQKKPAARPQLVLTPALAGAGSGVVAPRGTRKAVAWQRFGLLLPLAALVVTLSGIAHLESQRRVNEKAEIDAAMLSDDLPLNAYVDHGFHAYLSRSR